MAFITRMDVTNDVIVADARFDADTAPEYWRAAREENVSTALSATPRTWLQIRSVLDDARFAQNFHNPAKIGFPPDFAEQEYCNFISELTMDEDKPVGHEQRRIWLLICQSAKGLRGEVWIAVTRSGWQRV